jgi:hypothetical protein
MTEGWPSVVSSTAAPAAAGQGRSGEREGRARVQPCRRPAGDEGLVVARDWRDFCQHVRLRRNGGVGEGFDDLEIHTTRTHQYGLELSLSCV